MSGAVVWARVDSSDLWRAEHTCNSPSDARRMAATCMCGQEHCVERADMVPDDAEVQETEPMADQAETLVDVQDFANLLAPGVGLVRFFPTTGACAGVVVVALGVGDAQSTLVAGRFRDTRDGDASRYTGRIRASAVDPQVGLLQVGDLHYQITAQAALLDESPQGVAAARRQARVAQANAKVRAGKAVLASATAEVEAAKPQPLTKSQLRALFAKGELTDAQFDARYQDAPSA